MQRLRILEDQLETQEGRPQQEAKRESHPEAPLIALSDGGIRDVYGNAGRPEKDGHYQRQFESRLFDALGRPYRSGRKSEVEVARDQRAEQHRLRCDEAHHSPPPERAWAGDVMFEI